MKKTDLVTAGNELNQLLFDDPQIDVDGEGLEASIKEASLLLRKSDKISKITKAVLTELFDGEVISDEEVREAFEALGIVAAEDVEEAAAESTAKPTRKQPKDAATKKEAFKGPGVIATIVSMIEKAGKDGVSKEEILNELVAKFPDRAKDSMAKTINVQVPNRISKERFPIVKLENGKYKKK